MSNVIRHHWTNASTVEKAGVIAAVAALLLLGALLGLGAYAIFAGLLLLLLTAAGIAIGFWQIFWGLILITLIGGFIKFIFV